MMGLMARNILESVFDGFIRKNVLNRDVLYRVADNLSTFMKNTLDNIVEKTEMTGKILVADIKNPKKELSLSE
jgi:molybdate-binding protein